MMLKKKIKMMIIASGVGLVSFVLLITIIIAVFAAALAGAAASDKVDPNNYENNIEVFDITGTSGDQFNLNFIFSGWSIKNISGSGTITQKVKIPSFTGSNEAVVYQFLRKEGYTHEGACGIMGCLWAESGFNPCAIEKDNFWTGDNDRKRGYGICQWTNTTPPYVNGRRTNVINWLKSNGYDPYKNDQKLLIAQLKYMLQEEGYDGARAYCKNSKSIKNATKYWLQYYEGAYTQSYYQTRSKKAEEISEKYKNYNPASGDAYADATLEINIVKSGDDYTFTGTLDGIDIAGTFSVSSGKVSGTGYYGEGASPGGYGDGAFIGGLSGTSEQQRRILNSVAKWKDPFRQGYAYLCEGWVGTVYRDAGLGYNGACCASKSRDKNAITTGKIPAGAVIYSGKNYNCSVWCGCGRNAGHVAIYIGNNKVAGSQIPYIMSVDDWIKEFGYGGWSFSGNQVDY